MVVRLNAPQHHYECRIRPRVLLDRSVTVESQSFHESVGEPPVHQVRRGLRHILEDIRLGYIEHN